METAITKYTILPLIVLQNKDQFWLEGYIVKVNQKLLHIKDKEKYWRNIIRVIRSYIPGSINRRKLEIHCNGQIHHVQTNKYGFLKINLPVENGEKIHQDDFKFYLIKKEKKYSIDLAKPFILSFNSIDFVPRGVISDIDDTVLVTHTKNPLKKIRTLLIKNAYKRKAVKQMRDFYHHFASQNHAFFYVSNSEANLFPMIRLFLEHQNLPLGPIFLKSFRKWRNLFNRKKSKDRGTHKKEKIRFLLDIFPFMNFILIGDDSQQDPEIYAFFAKKYPQRIKHIYIRNVKRMISKKRQAEKHKLWEDYKIRLTYFKNPVSIFKHNEIEVFSKKHSLISNTQRI